MFPAKQGERTEKTRLPLAKAVFAATGAFGVALALDWSFHPVFSARHPDRLLEECGLAALVVFASTLVVGSVKKPWQ